MVLQMWGAANRRPAYQLLSWVGRLAAAIVLSGSFTAATAATSSTGDAHESAPPGLNQAHDGGPGLGEATFQRICAACHTSLVSRASSKEHPPDETTLRALPREMLRQLSPEAVLTALTSGKMQAQGSLLSD